MLFRRVISPSPSPPARSSASARSIAGERVVVAAQIQVGEADRVQVPGRVRPLTELLVNVERLLRLLDRRLVVAEREGRVGRRRRARAPAPPDRSGRAEPGQERAERALRFAVPAFALEADGVVERRRRGRAGVPVVVRTTRTSGGTIRRHRIMGACPDRCRLVSPVPRLPPPASHTRGGIT